MDPLSEPITPRTPDGRVINSRLSDAELLELLRVKDLGVVRAAILEAEHRKLRAAADRLRGLVHHPNLAVAILALHAALSIGDQRQFEQLIGDLGSIAKERWNLIARWFRPRLQEQIALAILPSLLSADPAQRRGAIRALGTIEEQWRHNPKVIAWVSDLLARRSELSLNQLGSLTWALGVVVHRDQKSHLLVLAQHEHPTIHQLALQTISELLDEHDLELAVRLALSDSPEQRAAAAPAIRQYADHWSRLPSIESVAPAICSRLRRTVPDPIPAIDLAGALRLQSASDALIDLLEHPSAIVRQRTVAALQRMRSQKALPWLVCRLADRDEGVSAMVGNALRVIHPGWRSSPAAVQAVPLLLGIGDETARITRLDTAANLAFELSNGDVVNALITTLESHNRKVREHAVRALLRRTEPRAMLAAMSQLEAVGSIASDARRSLVKAISQIPNEALIEAVADPSPHVRAQAMRELGQRQPGTAIELAADLLMDRDPSVRRAAVDTIAKIEGDWRVDSHIRRVVETIVQRLRRCQEQGASVDECDVYVLGRIGSAVDIPALRDIIVRHNERYSQVIDADWRQQRSFDLAYGSLARLEASGKVAIAAAQAVLAILEATPDGSCPPVVCGELPDVRTVTVYYDEGRREVGVFECRRQRALLRRKAAPLEPNRSVVAPMDVSTPAVPSVAEERPWYESR